jgi:hypothetical protein
MDGRRLNLGPVAVIILLLLAMAGAYVAAYILRSDIGTGYGTFRVYSNRWEATVFSPAAKVESRLTGSSVRSAYIKRSRSTGQRLLDAVE